MGLPIPRTSACSFRREAGLPAPRPHVPGSQPLCRRQQRPLGPLCPCFLHQPESVHRGESQGAAGVALALRALWGAVSSMDLEKQISQDPGPLEGNLAITAGLGHTGGSFHCGYAQHRRQGQHCGGGAGADLTLASFEDSHKLSDLPGCRYFEDLTAKTTNLKVEPSDAIEKETTKTQETAGIPPERQRPIFC